MPKLTQEELLNNLDFKCARCQAECTKINAAEPELGYISKADGTFQGPLCTSCANEIPMNERATRKLPETAFLIVIRPDGEGAYVTTEGVGISYLRDPLPYDILNCCRAVSTDINDALFAQKLLARIAGASAAAQKSRKIIVPR